ncbi:hypothetical protein I312_104175 [Cryptococcus bacillisporus CA1280]|uniref:uncharacterized protein n=1 Tax=Cryptococcus bacillisporus CA1280 TaxID=1296109 RepID=UPI003367A499
MQAPKMANVTGVGAPQDTIKILVPSSRMKHDYGLLSSTSDPSLAKSNQLLSNTVHTQDPPRRTTYHLLPNAVALKKQAIRSFKPRLKEVQCHGGKRSEVQAVFFQRATVGWFQNGHPLHTPVSPELNLESLPQKRCGKYGFPCRSRCISNTMIFRHTISSLVLANFTTT